MDIANVSSLSTALSQAKSGDVAGTLILKKALDIQEQFLVQLLEGIPQAVNPPHLGNSIDVKM